MLHRDSPRAASCWTQLPSHDEAGRKHRRYSVKAIFALLATVCVCYALRYVLDVKVTIQWRVPAGLVAQQHDGAKHCSNSCYKARDGVCDEGRPHKNRLKRQQQEVGQQQQGLPRGVSAVHCDLGTDCRDCGPWWGPQADEAWSESELPVAFLQRRNVSVRIRPTSHAASPVNFSFAYADPSLDVDVSQHYEKEGVVELGISQIFFKLLSSERCSSSADKQGGLVLDVGANFGWFSVLSAWLGCSVIAWEPVPHFRALLSYNLARNRLTHKVEVRQAVVANPPGERKIVVVPDKGIWGTAGIMGSNVDAATAADGYQQVEAVSESVDEVLLGRHVDVMKVDVEGYEAGVMATAQQALEAGTIDNIVMEYSPGVLERAARWGEMSVPPLMLLNLIAAGYKLGHLTDEFVRVWAPGRSITAQLPRLRWITAANLQYDLWDAQAFSTGWLNVDFAGPFCQQMVELHLDNQGIPERLHPKSYHAMFGHNTNVWASRQHQVIEPHLGKPVGIFPLDMPTNSSWFPPQGSDEGLGGTTCRDLADDIFQRVTEQGENSTRQLAAHMAVLIGRRCRCTHGLPCERHAAAAEQCAQAGSMPYKDLPSTT